jgi:hypothetical protein
VSNLYRGYGRFVDPRSEDGSALGRWDRAESRSFTLNTRSGDPRMAITDMVWQLGLFWREQRQSGDFVGSRVLLLLLFFIPNTYQNGAVLVSVENLNSSPNGAVLVLILIWFFFSFFLQEDILVTYHCQNDVILIFHPFFTVILMEGVKM